MTDQLEVHETKPNKQTHLRWELLSGIVRKDLQVKYQGSVIGFLWSLANPLLVLAVYSFVFGVVLKSGIPDFGFYLMSGLLVWNFFAGSVSMACGAVLGNAGLVQKVPFPLAVLPLASVGFNLVQLLLQLVVLVVVMLVAGFTAFIGPGLVLLVPALLVAVVLTCGVSFLVAALNVRYRDTTHLVEVLLMAGFWLVPIVYPVYEVAMELKGTVGSFLYWLNPMAGVVVSMQRALYASDTPIINNGVAGNQKVLASTEWSFYIERLGLAGVISLAMLALGVVIYRRMSADFAETL